MTRTILAALCALLTATGAFGATCQARDVIEQALSEKYGEAVTGEGMVKVRGQPAIMQVWTNAEKGTFSIVIAHADGVSCLMAAGEHYSTLTPVADLGDPT